MKLVGITEIYEQDEDCCGRADETGQDITISTHNGGGGSYVVIQTERWAMEAGDIIKLVAKMKDMLRRVDK